MAASKMESNCYREKTWPLAGIQFFFFVADDAVLLCGILK